MPGKESGIVVDRKKEGEGTWAAEDISSQISVAGTGADIGVVDPGQQNRITPQEDKINTIYRVTNGLAQQMEKARIAEYTQLLHSPWRLIGLNILSGAARGVGIALGFTFFAATIIYLLQMLGALNLPIIGDYIADIVRIVQHQLELKTF